MAQTPDAHLRLLIGDFAVQLAMIRAENEQLHGTVGGLQAEVAALQAQLTAAKKKKKLAASTKKKPARKAIT